MLKFSGVGQFKRNFVVFFLLAAGCSLNNDTKKARYLAEGNAHFKRDQYDQALSLYRKAIEADPRFGEAYYRAGLTALQLRKWDEAGQDLERAVELLPNNLDAYAKLANLYLFAYDANKNLRGLLLDQLQLLSARLHSHFPGTYDDLRLRGYVALFKNDMPLALEQLREANRLKPHEPDVALAYMQALEANRQPDLAEKVGKEVLEQRPDAIGIYDALFRRYTESNRAADAGRILQLKIKNNPKNADGYLELAAWQFATNKQAEMLATLNRIGANQSDFPAAPLLVGDFYLRAGLLPQALAQYQRGAQAEGTLKVASKKRMVEVLVQQKHIAEAGQVAGALLKENPKDPEVIALEASVAVATEDPNQVRRAVALFQSVLGQLPDDFVLRFQYARALLLSGDLDAAAVQCQESLRLRPEYIWPKVLLAHIALRRGRAGNARTLAEEIATGQSLHVAFQTAGQRPQERPVYESILGIKAPKSVALHELLAELSQKNRRLGLALEVPETRRRQAPQK